MLIKDNFISIKKTLHNINPLTKIVVVTKNQDKARILQLVNIGHTEFGENKMQEAKFKWTDLLKTYPGINLHFIGRLQSNKIKEIYSLFNYVHSLDSEKLALLFSNLEKKNKKKLKYFIQVNIGNEIQKSGIQILNIKNFILFCKNLDLNILGLMCIPLNNRNVENYFLKLKELNDQFNFTDLSMGMSSDYPLAAKLGATFVRIGSAIFEEKFN